MAEGGFAGGFSQGWSQGAQRATLYQQLGIQKADQALREKQFTVQQDQFNRDLNLRTRNQDLQQRQEERLAQHQDFTQKLQAKAQEIQLRQQDVEEIKQINSILKLAEGGNVPLASAALDVYAQKLGIDTKSDQYKSIQKMIMAMPEQSIADLQNFFVKMTPSMDAGSATVLAKYFLSNPEGALKMGESLMAHQASLAASAASQAQADAPVQFGRPVTPDYPSGTEFGTRTSVIGKPGPPRQAILSVPEQLDVESGTLARKTASEYAVKVYDAADEATAIIPHVETLRAAAVDQKFVTGPAGTLRYSLGKWAEFLGIDKELEKMFPDLAKAIGDPAQAEAIKQAQGFIAEKIAQSMSRLTNIQFSFVQGVVPGLMTSPEGTLIFADLMDRFADRAKKVKALYSKYENSESGSFIGFRKEKDDLDRTDPIINKELMDRITRVTKGAPGMGINLPAVATAAAEAAGKSFVTVKDMKFPVVTQRSKTALSVIQTARGNMPYAESEEDLKLLQPGTIFFYGPAGQLAVKEAEPEATKPAPVPSAKPGANSVVRIPK